MAIRILWDEEEAAILLDALVRVLEEKITRDIAISEVSFKLRERAKRKGIKIDEIFRNKNGIQLQMSAMEYIFTNGKAGLNKGKVNLFQKIVDMYKTDRTSYEKLLEEARQEVINKNSVQDDFFVWLATKIPATQLSDYYMLYANIDSFCYSNNIIHQNLFDTRNLSEISAVIDTVNKNQEFRRKYRMSISKMATALKYYNDFLNIHPELVNVNTSTIVNEQREQSVITSSQQEISTISAKKSNTINTIESLNENYQEYCLNFNENSTFIDTEPVTIIYFENEFPAYSNWKKTYAKIVTILQDDYPEIFIKLLGKNIFGRGSADVGRGKDKYLMYMPKEIGEDLYIETYYTISDIVKKIRTLLDMCNVDYENLKIKYRKKQARKTVCEKSESQPLSPLKFEEKQEQVETVSKKTGRSAFMEWLKGKNTDIGHILGYASDINKCSKYAIKKNITADNLFEVSDIAKLFDIRRKLFSENDVVVYDSKHGKSLRDSFQKLIEFREFTFNQKYNNSSETLEIQEQQGQIRHNAIPVISSSRNGSFCLTEEEVRFENILIEHFGTDGYQLGRAIFRGRFKRFYSAKFGADISATDEKMESILQRIGTVRDGRVFPKQDPEQNNLIENIVNDVVDTLNAGASVIYIESIYEKYQQQLADSLHIYNMDALTNLLMDNAKKRYYQRYMYLVKYGSIATPEKDVLRLMKTSHQPLNYEEIHKKLWYIPYNKIKSCLSIEKSIVNVAPETWFYAPNIPINAEELSKLIALIQTELDNRSYITDVELISIINAKLPSIAVNTENFTVYGLRNCLGYILHDYFSFQGPIISDIGNEISMGDVYTEFARQHEKLTIEDLRELSREMQTTIYWESIMNEQIRISETEFVRRDLIRFETESIDAILDEMCSGDYMSIKDVSLFLYFPTIGYQWNSYVLESYLYKGSKKFKLLHTSFVQGEVCGAMVRTDSKFEEYQEVIVDVLSKSNALNNNNTALKYIVELGYQQRLRLTGVEEMIKKAKLLKEKRETEEK